MSVYLTAKKLEHLSKLLKIPVSQITSKAKIMGGLTNQNLRIQVSPTNTNNLSKEKDEQNKDKENQYYFYQCLSKVPYFIDRTVESSICKLLQTNKGYPKIIHKDGQESLREFITDIYSRSNTSDFSIFNPSFEDNITKEIAKVHSTDIAKIDSKLGQIKKPKLVKFLEDYPEIANKLSSREYLSRHIKPQYQQNCQEILAFYENKVKPLLQYLQEDKVINDNKGLCHNDIQIDNFLIKMNQKDNATLMIDFEYADYNFIHHDLANMFSETEIVYQEPKSVQDKTMLIKDYPFILEGEFNRNVEKYAKFLVKYNKYSNRNIQIEDILKMKLFGQMYWSTLLIAQPPPLNDDFDIGLYLELKKQQFSFYFETYHHRQDNPKL